jgi:hypothetical protein
MLLSDHSSLLSTLRFVRHYLKREDVKRDKTWTAITFHVFTFHSR